MRTLTPAVFKESYYSGIEQIISDLFNQMIYAPMIRDIRSFKEITNSTDALEVALSNGRVEYKSGLFTGRFTAKISKRLQELGARWDKRKQGFFLDRTLPSNLQIAISTADSRYAALSRSLVQTLTSVDVDYVVNNADLSGAYESVIGAMDSAILKTLRSVIIEPKISITARTAIAEQWGNNLKLYIKRWTDSNIIKLRGQIEKNTFDGHRSENLLKTIIDSYGVSKRKAKFLARQETSLLMSKMRQQRYMDAGITQYKWSTSHDERVRKKHIELDGKVYKWTEPPIVDTAGNHGNPGEDYNCRCVPIPILPE